jgi:GT2 family glycosyltransferase
MNSGGDKQKRCAGEDVKTNQQPQVSVIIVNLNGKNWLARCIPSVLRSSYPRSKLEIVLVDNGSTDGSVSFARSLLEAGHVNFKIVANANNRGWSPANNQGAAVASGELLVFLSNDMEVAKKWLREIAKVFREKPKAGVVQCNSLSLWDRKTLDSSMNYLDCFGFAYGYAPQQTPCRVFFAEGMAFAIKRKVFAEIGGFDDYFFMEYDDIDLCWRVHLAGHEIYFAPRAVVYHARGGTVGSNYFKRRHKNVTRYVRNQYATLFKCCRLGNFIKAFAVVSMVQHAKAMYFIAQGEFKLAYATLKGCFEFFRDVRVIWEKRKFVQAEVRKVSDRQIMRGMHPFKPLLLLKYLTWQKRGRKFIQKSKPPLKVGAEWK